MIGSKSTLDKFEFALCISIMIFFFGFVSLGIKFTYVPLGDDQKLIQSLNSDLLKNNHAIVSMHFLYMNHEDFADFQNVFLERLHTLSLMDSISDFRIRNIFMHLMVGVRNIDVFESTLTSTWKEPDDTFQKLFSLYVILNSKNEVFINKWREDIRRMQVESKNEDVRLLSKIILDENSNVSK